MLEGTRRCPAQLRGEIASALRVVFARKGCVREVESSNDATPATDSLVLRVLVDDYKEETRWDIGLIERAQPMGGHDPALDSQVVLDVTAQVELRAGPERPPVRLKTFAAHVSRSPRAPGEDAVSGARSVLVDKIVREAHGLVCKGSRRTLSREIEQAFAPPAR